MSSRWLKPLLLALLVAGGYWFQRTVLRPEPKRLETWAEQALRDVFGPHLTHGAVVADPLDGVRIERLRVQGPGDAEPSLSADAVEVRHDVLALSAGVFRLKSIVLRAPRISTHETAEGGLELDFPFALPREGGAKSAPLPSLVVVNGTFRLRAHEASPRFRAGYVLELGRFHLRAVTDATGVIRIDGSFLPQGLGMLADEEITFRGFGNPEKGTLDVDALWERLLLTPEVRDIVAPGLLERVQAQRLSEGPHRLAVRVVRDPAVEGGRIRLIPHFQGTAKLDIGMVPGAETIDARTREQINELFGKIDLTVEVSGSRVDIRKLTTSLAGAEVRAQGRIEDGGEVVDVDIHVDGLRLDDPALLAALGPLGDQLRDEFRVGGRADVRVTLARERGGPFRFEAVVDLVDASLVYVGTERPGTTTPSGAPMRTGFPYSMDHCYGRITVRPGEVLLSGIEGRHGTAPIRIRGHAEKSRTGGPTGFVRWGDGDSNVLLTVEAKNLPVDADLKDAVDRSELAGMFDRFRPGGKLDRVVVDIVKHASLDVAAVVELDVELEDETFRFDAFPLPLEGVVGSVSLRRPVLENATRGRTYEIVARATAAGGTLSIDAHVDETKDTGRVRVQAEGVRLEGALAEALAASAPGKGAIGEAWDFLRPIGVIDVVADLPAGSDPGPDAFRVTMRGVSLRLGGDDPDAGIAVTGLVGAVSVEGTRADVADVTGEIEGASLAVNGLLDGGPKGRWDLRVDTKGLALTRGVLAAIRRISPCDPVLPAGVVLLPGGRLDLSVHLRRDPAAPGCPLTAAVAIRNAELNAQVGDLAFTVRGGFSVDGDDVRIEDLTAEGKGLSLSIPKARWTPNGIEGRLSAKLLDVRVSTEVLGLLPPTLRATFQEFTKDRVLQAPDLQVDIDEKGAMTIKGSLGLTARPNAPPGGAPRGLVEMDSVVISATGAGGERTIRGRLVLKGLDLDVGTRLEDVQGVLDLEDLRVSDAPSGSGVARFKTVRVAGLALTDVVAPVSWKDGLLVAPDVRGFFYGGKVMGHVSVHTTPPVAFAGRLATSGVVLDLLRADVAPTLELSGTGEATLEFESTTGEFKDLVASGSAEVCCGDLGALPPVASIPALLASAMPDSKKPKFQRARFEFRIVRERIEADCMTLSGPLFDMEGQGTLDFDGNADILLTPQFLKSLTLPGAMQVPGVRDVLGLLREDPLYVVRIQGPLATAKPEVDPLPFLGRRRLAPPAVVPIPFEAETTRRIPRWFR